MNRSTKRRSRTPDIPNLSELTEQVEQSFFEVMRRPPRDGDRLFYWSYCYSDAEFRALMIATMLRANTPQRLIHIFDKTGFMVSKEGYKRLTKDEKEEIKRAGLEYDALDQQGQENVYKLSDYEEMGTEKDDPLRNALYIFGNFIERNVNSGRHTVDVQRFVCAYLLVRTYRIVRAIFRSQKYTTSEEALVLVRSLYEIYCKLVYATRSKRNAKYLLDSDFGLSSGVYEVLVKDGKTKRHILVNRRSGKQIPRTRSFYEYISTSRFSEDRELFEVLYEYLSSFVHSGSRHIASTWIDNSTGFSLTHDNDENLKVFVLMLTCLISSMTMQGILSLRNISEVSRWDISLFCFATRHIVMESAVPHGSELEDLFPKMKARAAVLPAKVKRFITRP
ncbi:DUF5677 domain-containing protein [Bradyrhizobium cenepequi]